jgi:hypothetical protein
MFCPCDPVAEVAAHDELPEITVIPIARSAMAFFI